ARALRRARGQPAGRGGGPPARRRRTDVRGQLAHVRRVGRRLAPRAGGTARHLCHLWRLASGSFRAKERRFMSHTTGLRCRECGTETPIAPLHVCETCFGPLEVQYDYPAIRRTLTRELVESRPRNLWRYREL